MQTAPTDREQGTVLASGIARARWRRGGSWRYSEVALAEALKLKLPNLHQRLKALHEAGAIGRETDETAQRGRRHDYQVLDPSELAGITG